MTKNEYLNQGLQYFARQKYEDAIHSLKEAINLDDRFELAYNALAEVYNRIGDLERAVKTAKKLIELNPEDPVAHASLSRLYVQQGKINEAEKELALSNRLSEGEMKTGFLDRYHETLPDNRVFVDSILPTTNQWTNYSNLTIIA